ncbi:type I-G CRISPR-associated protein, Cas3-extension family [Azohydromonas lata]|uniref:type I-G CRISPR-associated protein, Cas3-extension family n=1 Tax=Azohydromonas lata TaxID=45677 RepID=UPI000B21B17D|nr:hypothetical protein [Azohydromonas lata]
MNNADPEVALTGVPIASPIGFMAALGLLRVCAQDHGRPVRLAWTPTHAVLHGVEASVLRELLAEHMRGRAEAPEFNFEATSEDGRRSPAQHIRTITPQDFRAAAAALCGNERALGFLAGFATDAVVNDKGFVARSRFDFTSGRQQLLHKIRQLGVELSPTRERPRVGLALRIERALSGGPYEDWHSLGWDPATLMTHAHQPMAPTDRAPPGQPMLVWLAIESLPLHPVVATGPRRAGTTGFAGSRAYVWPQWHEPLSLAEVRLLRQRPVGSLEQLPGVEGVWSSAVTSAGEYDVFQPAARTCSDALAVERFARADNAG